MTPAEIDSEFKRRAKTEHPDVGGSAERFAALVAWRDKMLNPNVVMFGKVRMEYIIKHIIGGMNIYIGKSSVVYEMPDGLSQSHVWKFPNDKVKDAMTRFLPDLIFQQGNVWAFRRKPSQVLMMDIPKPIAPEHVAWMTTRMLNIACYLHWSGVAHCAISPEFLLVDLEDHGVALCGPTSYLTEIGTRPLAVPGRTFSAIPSLGNKDTVASIKIDLKLIRLTALQLMGERTKSPYRSWLDTPPAETALNDYAAWEKTLGKRVFVKYSKTAKDIYDGI